MNPDDNSMKKSRKQNILTMSKPRSYLFDVFEANLISELNKVYIVKIIINVWKIQWFTNFSIIIINFFFCFSTLSKLNTSNFFLTVYFLCPGDLDSTDKDLLLINNLGCYN